MQLPPNETDIMFEQLLQELPEDMQQMARDFKAFSRARKIKSPTQLFRVVLLYSGLDKTLREVAGTLSLLEERITDSSVAERLVACRPWVKALLEEMLPVELKTCLPSQLRFVVIDGSNIQAPGAKGTHYRLHISLDMVSLEFIQIIITDKHTGESLKNFTLGKGDVAVSDRGYCHAQAIAETVDKGAEVVVRLNVHNLPLFHRDGSAIDWMKLLKGQYTETVRSLPVVIGSKGENRVLGYVHAYRLPKDKAEAARRACRKRNTKKRRTPKKTTLYLAGWVLILTTIDPQVLSSEAIVELYRLRWQVELAIKRFKSLLDADKLRAKEGSPLAEVWLHGKMLYALLVESLMRRQMGDSFSRLDWERTATWWRPYKMVQDEIAPIITGVMLWHCDAEAWDICLSVLSERPRNRKLQRLPVEVRDLIRTNQSHTNYPSQKSMVA